LFDDESSFTAEALRKRREEERKTLLLSLLLSLFSRPPALHLRLGDDASLLNEPIEDHSQISCGSAALCICGDMEAGLITF
jgi:hypothetical protein